MGTDSVNEALIGTWQPTVKKNKTLGQKLKTNLILQYFIKTLSQISAFKLKLLKRY